LQMAHNCPNCGTTMVVDVVHGVSLDVCPNCGGTWFEADELRALIHSAPHALEELGEMVIPKVEQVRMHASEMRCPNGHGVLINYHYMYDSPIILHTCTTCGGFWVAAEEVAKMEGVLNRAHQPMTAEEESAYMFAKEVTDHEQEMNRLRNWGGFFNSLRRYTPGWYGFL